MIVIFRPYHHGYHHGFRNHMFSISPFTFTIISFIILVVIILLIIQKDRQRKEANPSQATPPVLDVDAKLVAKRTDVNQLSTTYHVTFEVQSKDRLEFVVSGTEYGQLVENDTGKLTFQGPRYLGFERNSETTI